MIHLHCTIASCNWVSERNEIPLVIVQYLAHTIREHWDLLLLAHDNPEMLDEAERILS
jgi:hypothetical protein